MNNVQEIIALLWKITNRNKRTAANVVEKDNEITVNILTGRRWKRFKSHDQERLLDQLRLAYGVART